MNRFILMCSAAAMAVASLSANASMTELSDSSLRDISGQAYDQAYVLTVGTNSYTAPFAYELFTRKAPASVVTVGKNLVATWAPAYPGKVSTARSIGLSKANAGLTAATTTLQAIPYVGGLVPAVSISTGL